MKAILYARVSTDDQTVRMQIAAMREYCKRKKWTVVDEIEETGSGANRRRPKREEILKKAARAVGPGFDTVVCWKLDRWSRSLVDLVTTLDELQGHGVAFASVTEGLDFTTPGGRAFVGLLAVFAQFERELIQERVNAGIAKYREKHDTWGRPATARARAPYIRRLRKEGKSFSQIEKITGLSHSSVYRILKGEV